jgi:hypothetical protein
MYVEEGKGGRKMNPSDLYYPFNLIADLYEKVKLGIKRVDIEDDNIKIMVYVLQPDTIRIDIKDKKYGNR